MGIQARGRTPDWDQSFQVERRSLVLPQHRVLFVPVPKSGTTSVRWALAGLAGLTDEHVLSSIRPVVSPELAAHDLSRWPRRNRWDRLPEEERHEVVGDPSWLRFAVVRNPWTRLWSAWQSKALLQEPIFVDWFGQDSWWPRIPATSGDVVEDFHAFVHSLADPAQRPVNPHWQPQSTILAQAPWLSHIGRTEQMGEVMERLASHVGVERETLRIRRENKTPLPYDPGLYDEPARDVVRTLFGTDLTLYGYPEDPGPGDLDGWLGQQQAVMPAIAELISRHRRIGMLARQAKEARGRARELEQQLRDV